MLVGLGIILHRTFNFEMRTFSKLLFYYYIPALTFIKIYEAKTSATLLLLVFGFLVMQFIILYSLSRIIAGIRRLSSPMTASFTNSIVLSNNGNIGIPVNDLVFHHNPLAMSVQMVVVLFEIFVTFTFGILNTSASSTGLQQTAVRFLKTPVFFCFVAGLSFNLFHLQLPGFIWTPVNTIANGMLSMALLSIGAQIARINLNQNTATVLTSSFIRLIIAPVIGFFLISQLHLQGVIAQALWIASAMPTSRNSAALALEYNNEPEFAAQVVLVTTLLSSITLTLVVYSATLLFP
ncbi:AEC family transporter [Sporomusa termitida]|uniref:2a69: auxin efflux carrier n=1 Tax=Sporomusa termitida TaxID=2377 RepID=A0A517DNK5_9FIRM|nr:AEC family transporter [Sporomusa termitida]QDR78950.1 2a69: auxin efflux carrier [Sporomusa termitida]